MKQRLALVATTTLMLVANDSYAQIVLSPRATGSLYDLPAFSGGYLVVWPEYGFGDDLRVGMEEGEFATCPPASWSGPVTSDCLEFGATFYRYGIVDFDISYLAWPSLSITDDNFSAHLNIFGGHWRSSENVYNSGELSFALLEQHEDLEGVRSIGWYALENSAPWTERIDAPVTLAVGSTDNAISIDVTEAVKKDLFGDRYTRMSGFVLEPTGFIYKGEEQMFYRQQVRFEQEAVELVITLIDPPDAGTPHTDTASESEMDADTVDTATGRGSAADAGKDSATVSAADTVTVSDTDTDTDANSDANSNTGVDTDADSHADTDRDIDTVADEVIGNAKTEDRNSTNSSCHCSSVGASPGGSSSMIESIRYLFRAETAF